MKELWKSIFLLVVIGAVLAGGYFFTPASVKVLHERISQSEPFSPGASGSVLWKDFGDFMNLGLPEKTPPLYFYWYSNQRKMADLRVSEAMAEIKNTRPGNDEIRIWSLLNMGVVIKTEQKTVAIDTANLPFSRAHDDLAEMADIFLVTHADGDHFDLNLLKKAVANNRKVVFPEGLDPTGEISGGVGLASGETSDSGGVKITAYQTDHRGDGNFNEPCVWYVIEIGKFKLLHTGDGREFKNREEYQKVYSMKDIDLLLANNQMHPYNVRDLQPRVLIPLHLFKFMSGRDLYRESTVERVSEVYAEYQQALQGIKIQFLLPGESVSYAPR